MSQYRNLCADAGWQLFSYGDFGISRLMISGRRPNKLAWVMCQNLPTSMIISTRNTKVEMACPDVCQNLTLWEHLLGY